MWRACEVVAGGGAESFGVEGEWGEHGSLSGVAGDHLDLRRRVRSSSGKTVSRWRGSGMKRPRATPPSMA